MEEVDVKTGFCLKPTEPSPYTSLLFAIWIKLGFLVLVVSYILQLFYKEFFIW